MAVVPVEQHGLAEIGASANTPEISPSCHVYIIVASPRMLQKVETRPWDGPASSGQVSGDKVHLQRTKSDHMGSAVTGGC